MTKIGFAGGIFYMYYIYQRNLEAYKIMMLLHCSFYLGTTTTIAMKSYFKR